MVNDELEEEIKEKQAYLKSSSYVEVQINVDDDSEGAGEFLRYGDTTRFVPASKKPTVRANEVVCNSNE